jgi:peptide/nickel transport system permease protein
MTDAAAAAVGPGFASARPAGPWRIAIRRLRRDRAAVFGACFIVLLLLAVGAGAPIAGALLGHGPNDPFPYAVDENLKPAGPWTHVPAVHDIRVTSDEIVGLPPPPKGTPNTLLVLGADGSLGRDELLRLLYGGRVTLEVALLGAMLSILIGAVLGASAGFLGGWVDAIVSRLVDLVMSFPLLLFLLMLGRVATGHIDTITLGGLLNQGVLMLILLIGAFTWFYPARIVRAEVLSLKERDFVEAAEMVGAKNRRILWRHLVPHVAPALIAYATILISTNVMLEAGLSFLNVGVKLPTASWGSMLTATWGSLLQQNSYSPLSFTIWPTLVPSLAIFLTALAFNLLGEGFRAAFDPEGTR